MELLLGTLAPRICSLGLMHSFSQYKVSSCLCGSKLVGLLSSNSHVKKLKYSQLVKEKQLDQITILEFRVIYDIYFIWVYWKMHRTIGVVY